MQTAHTTIDASSQDGALSVQRESSIVSRQVWEGRSVYVKRYLEGDWFQSAEVIRERVRREAELSGRLAVLAGMTGRLGVVKVVDVCPDRAELVTEEVPGRILHDLLVGASGRSTDVGILRALYLAGHWLQIFQTLPIQDGDSQSICKDATDLIEYCDVRFQRLRQLGYDWPNPAARSRILNCLESLIAAAPTDDRSRVCCHCDYGPNNVLWDGQVLTPIDFPMARLERPLLDVSYFLHRIGMLRIYFPWRAWPTAAWRRAFLRGYGRPDAEQSPMYRALSIRHLICRLVTYVRRPPRNFKQRLHNAWVRKCVRWAMMQKVL